MHAHNQNALTLMKLTINTQNSFKKNEKKKRKILTYGKSIQPRSTMLIDFLWFL